MLSVVCVKAGQKYGPEYVNRLHQMVKRHLRVPHEFVCFTDDQRGLDHEITRRPLPGGLAGWWNKLYLFKQGVLHGRVLFLDLDTIICENINELAGYEGSFAILRDFYRKHGYGSGVMIWNGDHSYIWERWLVQGKPLDDGGDQWWIEQVVDNADRLQDAFPGKFVSWKADECHAGVPDAASVVCFHGVPKPIDLTHVPFVAQHWVGEAHG
jgi:hypothetical protein